MSVQANANGEHVRRTTGLPAGSASSEWGGWIKVGSYASPFVNIFARMGTFGAAPLIGIDTEETGADSLDAFVYDGAIDAVSIQTGALTDWVWVCVQHTAGTDDYVIKYRLEADTSVTTVGTITAPGGEVTSADSITLFDFGFGDPVNSTICCFFVSSTLSSDAALFARSNDLDFDGSGLNTWLRLADAATAAANDGTAGSWTATGTLADGANEPDLGGSAALDVGLATESDTAIARSFGTTLDAGRSDETDTALGRTLAKALTPQLAQESDLAHAPALFKSLGPGIATESNAAFSTFSSALAVGVGTETDAALGRTLTKSKNPGVAAEGDIALALTLAKALSVGLAGDAATAFARAVGKSASPGIATESDAAVGANITSGFAASAATEADTAVARSFTKLETVGLATVVETALAPGLTRRITPGVGLENDTAQPRSLSKTLALTAAQEQDAALSVYSPATYLTVGAATEISTSQACALSRHLLPAVAEEVAVAFGVAFGKSLSVGAAAETDLAFSAFSPVGAFQLARPNRTVHGRPRDRTVVGER